jgi:hypothetical protein
MPRQDEEVPVASRPRNLLGESRLTDTGFARKQDQRTPSAFCVLEIPLKLLELARPPHERCPAIDCSRPGHDRDDYRRGVTLPEWRTP